ncbi:hypothetical protein [Natrinema ejinorense]|uniref:Uncharacterized protein n=1 Tax=Natrinema ejinorense TaxID=373386 RepID=A0A2A5QPG1_9EURY|nr:hypothetical protein [Natrinema ejinorense]PCR88623.1 hypothetical protein CP557_21550 [Natrinema ejinorense]
MPAKPPLPDGYELCNSVNGWHYDPDATRNAHVWADADDRACVAVHEFVDETYAKVIDTRAGAAENLFRLEYDTGDVTGAAYTDAKRAAVCEGVEKAVVWMETTAPEEWSHPEVCEAVFDMPAGYDLERYFHGDRETIVYYARDDVDECPLRGRGDDLEKLTPENAPYLYIHVWNGSGNATVALAPWTHAHGPGSKHPEVMPVVETPSECGLEVAITMARQWAREHADGAIDTDASGQAALERWSA